MSDIVSGVRQLIQDLIAPDLKAIAAKQDAMEKHMALQHDVLIKLLEAFAPRCGRNFYRCEQQIQLEVQRQLAPLSDRVAVLETQRARH